MNLETVILNFAMGAKRAQMILNAENLKDAQAIQAGAFFIPTGGPGAGSSLIPHVPLAIKEATFRYELKCKVNFSMDLTLGVQLGASLDGSAHLDAGMDSTIDLSITFQNLMSLTSEANSK